MSCGLSSSWASGVSPSGRERVVAAGSRDEAVDDRHSDAQPEKDQKGPRQAGVGDERDDDDDGTQGGAQDEECGETPAFKSVKPV
jgi:hypothetical protein